MSQKFITKWGSFFYYKVGQVLLQSGAGITKWGIITKWCITGIAPEITKDIFIEREKNGLDLRSQNKFLLPKANTVHYGHDSLKYFGCKIWNIIPNEMKCCRNV